MSDARRAAAPSTAPRSRWRWIRILVLVIVALLILAMAAGIWYILFRPSGPPPIDPGAPAIPAAILGLI